MRVVRPALLHMPGVWLRVMYVCVWRSYQCAHRGRLSERLCTCVGNGPTAENAAFRTTVFVRRVPRY